MLFQELLQSEGFVTQAAWKSCRFMNATDTFTEEVARTHEALVYMSCIGMCSMSLLCNQNFRLDVQVNHFVAQDSPL